eukprot:SAG22_NODE_13475_length_405_cov_1.003268_1_plen_78_part_01
MDYRLALCVCVCVCVCKPEPEARVVLPNLGKQLVRGEGQPGDAVACSGNECAAGSTMHFSTRRWTAHCNAGWLAGWLA